MGLGNESGPGQNLDSIRSPEAESFYFHFPDGNASIARLLVRIPFVSLPNLLAGRRAVPELLQGQAPAQIVDVVKARLQEVAAGSDCVQASAYTIPLLRVDVALGLTTQLAAE